MRAASRDSLDQMHQSYVVRLPTTAKRTHLESISVFPAEIQPRGPANNESDEHRTALTGRCVKTTNKIALCVLKNSLLSRDRRLHRHALTFVQQCFEQPSALIGSFTSLARLGGSRLQLLKQDVDPGCRP